MSEEFERIVIMQVSSGENGAGYVIITDGTNPIGYCLAINTALESPNGNSWPDPTRSIARTEYWWFATSALQDIRSGSLTGLTLDSSDLIPANSNPSKPTLNTDPLTAIPAQFGSTPYVQWKTLQDPTFSSGGMPTVGGAEFRLFESSDTKLCLGWKYAGAGPTLALTSQFWATTQTANNKPGFWFGSGPGAPKTAIVVSDSFSAVSEYPSTSDPYLKKSMALTPSTVPIGS